ncbi:DUF4251 domain-containing protein [Ravibacter arvi]|uniref:DUF4251 domain-containing protein n=1 Tax=Ravibacter arvi TaxID=2051041 RepID=A0ABP8LSE3_9BACT
MKLFIIAGSLAVALAFGACSSQKASTARSSQEISTAFDEQSYQFQATFLQPSRGRMRQIVGNYFMKVEKDRISADLPYFGRAYSAPIGGDGGIKFVSEKFTYDVKPIKNGGREVTIRVQDSQVVRDLFLTVFPDGSADLRVTPQNKTFISYRGDVVPLAK